MNRYEFYTRLDSYRRANPDEDKKDEIKHYGITGQKWGQRRWQYADGRFNPEGKERYFGSGKKTTNNGVSDYLNYKKTATDEPAKEFGSIFNKKNVSYNDPKYNPRINEENKIWDDVKEQQSKNWAKDKELVDNLAGKELKYYSEDPIISEYYSNIKADIANKMKEKYPSMNPNIIRMNTLHDENEPFVSGYDGQEELREQYKELHEKAIKYPPRSAKRVKLEGEAALVNAKEELNKKKIEEELNENVEKYIKENKNNILQDIDRIKEKIKEIDIADDYGDYYVTRALEEHNKKKYNNFNEKGLKDLSDDEWDDVKNIAKAEYEDDISMQNKWNNNRKFGSTEKEENLSNTMKNNGWEEEETKRFSWSDRKEKQYSKNIDNDEYDKKFIIHDDDSEEIGAKKIIENANDALNFLNKKGSYKHIIDEIADNQYEIYKEVMKDQGKKPVSKSEFIKNEGLTINEIGLSTSTNWNPGKIYIDFEPGEKSEWFGYDFEVYIDPKTGKYIEMYQS